MSAEWVSEHPRTYCGRGVERPLKRTQDIAVMLKAWILLLSIFAFGLWRSSLALDGDDTVKPDDLNRDTAAISQSPSALIGIRSRILGQSVRAAKRLFRTRATAGG
jgi:hypothetical protein